jgi:hypothetical protein
MDPPASHAQPQNILGQLHRTFLLPTDTTVIKHQGVKVAISGMEDVRHAQPRFGAESVNLSQDSG